MSDKFAYGRYHEEIDISSVLYEALTDGAGHSIPFHINSDAAVDLSVLLEDSAAYETYHFTEGDNPALVIAVAQATVTATLRAAYPYKPATTTINV